MGSDAISVVSALLEAGNVTGDNKLVEAAGCPRPALSASSLAPGV